MHVTETLAGKYTIYPQLTLGRGNFGSVFCGQDKTSGAKVAIKRVPNDKDLRIYFEREIKLMKTVRDGNVVQLLENNYIYMVLERCNGGTLTEFINYNHHLPELVTIKLLKDLVHGMQALDALNIVHRDLKPDNLLFESKSYISQWDQLRELSTLKIADFGVSRELVEGDLASTFVGAPELLRGQNYDKQIDMWSLGVILYQMLYGKTPFAQAKTQFQIIEMQQNMSPLETLNGTIGREMVNLVQKLLMVDPKQRMTLQQLAEHPLVTCLLPLGQTFLTRRLTDAVHFDSSIAVFPLEVLDFPCDKELKTRAELSWFIAEASYLYEINDLPVPAIFVLMESIKILTEITSFGLSADCRDILVEWSKMRMKEFMDRAVALARVVKKRGTPTSIRVDALDALLNYALTIGKELPTMKYQMALVMQRVRTIFEFIGKQRVAEKEVLENIAKSISKLESF